MATLTSVNDRQTLPDVTWQTKEVAFGGHRFKSQLWFKATVLAWDAGFQWNKPINLTFGTCKHAVNVNNLQAATKENTFWAGGDKASNRAARWGGKYCFPSLNEQRHHSNDRQVLSCLFVCHCYFILAVYSQGSTRSLLPKITCLTVFNLPGRFFFSITTTSLNSDSKSLTFENSLLLQNETV